MAEEDVAMLLKEEPFRLEVGRMIKEIRMHKGVSQSELCQKADVSRQYVSEMENGQIKRLDLEKVRKVVMACGEQLFITSSFNNPLQISDRTEREDAILTAFANGEVDKAEKLLKVIRRWNYPPSYLTAQCKRNVAIAVSYHFKDMATRSKLRMSDLLMGLSYLGCDKEAEYFIEMYERTIDSGEKSLSEIRVSAFKKGDV